MLQYLHNNSTALGAYIFAHIYMQPYEHRGKNRGALCDTLILIVVLSQLTATIRTSNFIVVTTAAVSNCDDQREEKLDVHFQYR